MISKDRKNFEKSPVFRHNLKQQEIFRSRPKEDQSSCQILWTDQKWGFGPAAGERNLGSGDL